MNLKKQVKSILKYNNTLILRSFTLLGILLAGICSRPIGILIICHFAWCTVLQPLA